MKTSFIYTSNSPAEKISTIIDFNDSKFQLFLENLSEHIEKNAKDAKKILLNYKLQLGNYIVTRNDVNFSEEEWQLEKEEVLKGSLSNKFILTLADTLSAFNEDFINNLIKCNENFVVIGTFGGGYDYSDLYLDGDNIVFKFFMVGNLPFKNITIKNKKKKFKLTENGFTVFKGFKPMSKSSVCDLFSGVVRLINSGESNFFVVENTTMMELSKEQIFISEKKWNNELMRIEEKSKFSKRFSELVLGKYIENFINYLEHDKNGYFKLEYKKDKKEYKALIHLQYNFNGIYKVGDKIYFSLDVWFNVNHVSCKPIKK